MSASEQRLGFVRLLAYGTPAIVIAMLTLALVVYIPAFYATEVGLSLSSVGLIFLLARAWDALIDPVIGHWSDQTRGRFGARKPWMVIGAPGLMVATWFLFQPTGEVGNVYLLAWIALFYIVWTMVQIPYLSWGAELSTDYVERNRIVGVRESMIFLGTIIATGLPIVVFAGSEPSIREILRLFAMFACIVLPFAVLLAIKVVPNGAIREYQQVSLATSLRVLRSNKPFLQLTAATFLSWLGVHVYNAAVLLIIEYGLNLPTSRFLHLVFVQFAVGIAVIPFVIRLANRFGKHRVLAASLIGIAVSLPLMALIPNGNIAAAFGLFMLLGVTITPVWILPTAIVADAVDVGRMHGGGDQSGLYMAIYNLSFKFALAVSVGIALPLIELGGFDPATAPGATGSLFVVGLLLPGLIFIPAAVLLWRYPIDRETHRDILRKLDAASGEATI